MISFHLFDHFFLFFVLLAGASFGARVIRRFPVSIQAVLLLGPALLSLLLSEVLRWHLAAHQALLLTLMGITLMGAVGVEPSDRRRRRNPQ